MYIKFQRLLSKQLLQFCSERKSNRIVTDEKNAIFYLLEVRIEPGPSNMPDERSTTAPCHSACSIILKITIEDIHASIHFVIVASSKIFRTLINLERHIKRFQSHLSSRRMSECTSSLLQAKFKFPASFYGRTGRLCLTWS